MYLSLFLSPVDKTSAQNNDLDLANSTESENSNISNKKFESSEDKDDKNTSPTIQKFSAPKITKNKFIASVQSIKRLTNMKNLHPIAQGSYGTVYKGIDLNDRILAIKSIPFSENGIECLLEASIMSAIVHPFINQAHSISLSNNTMNIVQTLADSDLYTYCRKERIGKPELRKILWQICQAVYCLHNENIIHGDIKAQNILVFGDTVKLCDFTLSVKYNVGQTFTVYSGTPTHRCPSVWKKLPWSIGSDIWSLGCTFYEIAKGKLLFPIQDENTDIKKSNLNCIYDFCEEMGQTVNYARYDIDCLEHRPFTETGHLRNLILGMLQLEPENRLTIKEILAHPYFRDQPKHIGYVVRKNESIVNDEKDISYAINFYKDYNAERCTIETAINIYRAVGQIDDYGVDLILLTCLLLSSKINFHQKFIIKPNKRLFDCESRISEKLGFRLHCQLI